MNRWLLSSPLLSEPLLEARDSARDLTRVIVSRRKQRRILEVKYELAASRFVVAAIGFELACRKGGFDPSQTRVPAGNSRGGQWTADAASEPITPEIPAKNSESAELSAAGNKKSPLWCWNQMQIDMLYCGSLIPAWRRAACRAQANERYAACISGKPLPPLPF